MGFSCVFPQDQPKPIWVPSRNVRHHSTNQEDGPPFSLADQGQRKRRRQRKHHTQKDKISWKDIHDLVTAAQVTYPPQTPSPLFSWLCLSFSMLTLLLPSLSPAFPTTTTGGTVFYTRETYNVHNKVLGTQDCPLEGCWTSTEILLHPDSIPPALSSAFLTETQVNVSRRSPQMELQNGIHQLRQHCTHQS